MILNVRTSLRRENDPLEGKVPRCFLFDRTIIFSLNEEALLYSKYLSLETQIVSYLKKKVSFSPNPQ